MAKKTILGVLGVDGTQPFTNNLKFISGGTTSSNANTLDAYVESTFTPTITFGDLAVGATYSQQTGVYTQIGNVIHFSLFLNLSSKGTSTGNVKIEGLPLPVIGSIFCPCSISLQNVTSGVGDTYISAYTYAGTSYINIYKMVAGVKTVLANTDITNTSQFFIAGTYFV